MSFINHLRDAFIANSNTEFATQMKSYMRNQFEFYGIKTKLRRDLLKTSVAHFKDDINKDIRRFQKNFL